MKSSNFIFIITQLELSFEKLFLIFNSSKTLKSLFRVLSIFEIIKLCLKLRKFQFQRIYIRENLFYEDFVGLSAKESENLTILEDNNLNNVNKKLILLDDIKKIDENNEDLNKNYEEVFHRSKKVVKLTNYLPIITEMLKVPDCPSNERLKIIIGEISYLLKPVIYCFMLLFFKYNSFKPYLLILFMDLLRIILQKNMVFYRFYEREEFIERNYEFIINSLFRRPFSSKIIRSKLIKRLFKQNSLSSKWINALLDLRSAFTLVLN